MLEFPFENEKYRQTQVSFRSRQIHISGQDGNFSREIMSKKAMPLKQVHLKVIELSSGF